MVIGTIRDGVVIDHIPAGRGMEIYRYLHLEEKGCEVALILNAPSVKYGKKDIIKIGETIGLDYDMLGYIAPQITVDVIRGGALREKLHPQPPKTLTGVLRCRNPRCITSVEQELAQIFVLTDADTATYRCLYCDTKAEKEG